MSNPDISHNGNTSGMAKRTDAVELTIIDQDKTTTDEAEKKKKIIEVRCANSPIYAIIFVFIISIYDEFVW